MRKERRVHPLLLVAIAVTLGAFGQVALKHGMSLIGGDGSALLKAIHGIITPYVLLGLSLYVFSTVIWLAVLATEELSYVYPMIATGYLLVSFLAWVFFREQISSWRIIGVVMICMGVAFVAATRK